MFAGGDRAKVENKAIKYFAGNAFRPDCAPTDTACLQTAAQRTDGAVADKVRQELDSAYRQLPDSKAQDRFERFADQWYGQPYFDCFANSGIGAQGVTSSTGPIGTRCMSEYADGTRRIEVTGLNTAGQPSFFTVFNSYIPWAVSMAKSGIDPSAVRITAGDPMPRSLRSYLETIKDKHDGIPAQEAERLFYEGLAWLLIPPAPSVTTRSIAGMVETWAKNLVAEFDAASDAAAKEALSEKAVSTFVHDVTATDKDLFAKQAPDGLFDGEKLGFTANDSPDLEGMAELRRLFVEARMNYRRQGGAQGLNLDDLAAKTADAVKGAVASSSVTNITKLGETLRPFIAVVELDPANNNLQRVLLSPAKVIFGDMPAILLGKLNAHNNPALALVLLDKWQQVERKAAEMGLDINAPDLRLNLAKDLALKLKPFASELEVMALQRVTDVKATGEVTLEGSPKHLITDKLRQHFNGSVPLEVLARLRTLFEQASADPERRASAQSTSDDDLALHIGIRFWQKLTYANYSSLPCWDRDDKLPDNADRRTDLDRALSQALVSTWKGFDSSGTALPLGDEVGKKSPKPADDDVEPGVFAVIRRGGVEIPVSVGGSVEFGVGHVSNSPYRDGANTYGIALVEGAFQLTKWLKGFLDAGAIAAQWSDPNMTPLGMDNQFEPKASGYSFKLLSGRVGLEGVKKFGPKGNDGKSKYSFSATLSGPIVGLRAKTGIPNLQINDLNFWGDNLYPVPPGTSSNGWGGALDLSLKRDPVIWSLLLTFGAANGTINYANPDPDQDGIPPPKADDRPPGHKVSGGTFIVWIPHEKRIPKVDPSTGRQVTYPDTGKPVEEVESSVSLAAGVMFSAATDSFWGGKALFGGEGAVTATYKNWLFQAMYRGVHFWDPKDVDFTKHIATLGVTGRKLVERKSFSLDATLLATLVLNGASLPSLSSSGTGGGLSGPPVGDVNRDFAPGRAGNHRLGLMLRGGFCFGGWKQSSPICIDPFFELLFRGTADEMAGGNDGGWKTGVAGGVILTAAAGSKK